MTTPRSIYYPRNREKAQRAKHGRFWCRHCDMALVGEYGKCPNCGRVQHKKKRIRALPAAPLLQQVREEAEDNFLDRAEREGWWVTEMDAMEEAAKHPFVDLMDATVKDLHDALVEDIRQSAYRDMYS